MVFKKFKICTMYHYAFCTIYIFIVYKLYICCFFYFICRMVYKRKLCSSIRHVLQLPWRLLMVYLLFFFLNDIPVNMLFHLFDMFFANPTVMTCNLYIYYYFFMFAEWFTNAICVRQHAIFFSSHKGCSWHIYYYFFSKRHTG